MKWKGKKKVNRWIQKEVLNPLPQIYSSEEKHVFAIL